mgnify:CR=1 FL=1
MQLIPEYHWLNGNKYYKLFLQPNLFGTTDVVCCWGRTGTKLGGFKVVPCSTQQEIESVINKAHNRRKTRGYVTIYEKSS